MHFDAVNALYGQRQISTLGGRKSVILPGLSKPGLLERMENEINSCLVDAAGKYRTKRNENLSCR